MGLLAGEEFGGSGIEMARQDLLGQGVGTAGAVAVGDPSADGDFAFLCDLRDLLDEGVGGCVGLGCAFGLIVKFLECHICLEC